MCAAVAGQACSRVAGRIGDAAARAHRRHHCSNSMSLMRKKSRPSFVLFAFSVIDSESSHL